MVVLFFIPTFKDTTLPVVLSGVLLLLAIALTYTNYVVKADEQSGQLVFGIKFFHRFYPKKQISPEQLSSMRLIQLSNKHWALQLQPDAGEPLLFDSRPTLDKMEKRRQEIEGFLLTRLSV